MKNRFIPAALSALAASLLFLHPAFSDSTTPSNHQATTKTINDGVIVVTATRQQTDIDQVLATSIVISREDIENSQAVDITDLLRNKAGIDISTNGGPGQTTSLFLRGAESDHTLILVDGVKFNPATLGVASIQNLPLNMIERVEIIMGPRSTLYGSDALGGVIQVFTRQRQTTEAGWRFGSYNTHELSASIHRAYDTGYFGIDLSGLRSDGFPARAGATIDSPYSNDSINIKAGRKFAGTQLDFQLMTSQGETDYYDFLLAPTSQEYTNTLASFSAATSATGNWNTKLRLSYFDDDIQQQDSNDYITTTRYEMDWQNDLVAGNSHLLTAGIQAFRDKAESISFGSGYEDETDTVGAYLQDQFETGSHRVNAGVRYTDNSAYDGNTSGELSYGYRLSDPVRLIASYATGFRTPSSTDRFGFGGNPDLEPETSQSLELSGRYSTAMHRGRISLFQNEIDELINFVDPDGFDGPVPGRNENIDRTRTRGVELAYTLDKAPFIIDANLTLQDPKDLDTDRQLARRAKQKFGLKAAYKHRQTTYSAEYTHVGERPDSAYSDITLDGYDLVNLSATTRLAERLRVGIRLENITDEDYQLADGFNSAGRSAFLNLRYINSQ